MNDLETIVFGSGCFWCTEAIFKELKGVEKVESGYAGGTTQNPSYYDVSDDDTGHAEVIKIEFDPTIIPTADLIDVFLNTHNPTTLNQQGNDTGTQYRSIILYTNEEQKKMAEETIKKNTDHYEQPIVTEIKPLDQFYPAESYHADYYAKHGSEPYCQVIISPKLQKLRQKYSDKLK